MNMGITSLEIEDFRSIRGSHHISLDASAVLIHGPNGTGKTSLLSAIEFGLTGSVASLARFDPSYIQHLPHKLSANGKCRVQIDATGFDMASAEMRGDGLRIWGDPILGDDQSRFFTERSYLPQAALGRLLEIYEHQDSRRTDSPLTRFVKELLGLEALDALIDGLHASGDVRRLREPAPRYWFARSDAAPAAKRVADAESAHKTAIEAINAAEQELKTKLEGLAPPEPTLNAEFLAPLLEEFQGRAEARLGELARRRRDLNAATEQLVDASGDDQAKRQSVEVAASRSREALETWTKGPGKQLHDLFNAIRKEFGQLPEFTSDPKETHEVGTRLVANELARLQALSESDQASQKILGEVQEALRQGRARLRIIENELESDKGANQELAEALTAISSHILDEACPVCGRDFSEVSETSLAAHVSGEVQRLISTAARVESLVKDRSLTVAAITQAQRQEADLIAKRLSPDQRDEIQLNIARLTEWRNSLAMHYDTAVMGASLQEQASASARELSILNTRKASISGLRPELSQHAQALGRPTTSDDVPLQTILADLIAFVEEEEDSERRLVHRISNIEEALADLSIARTTAVELAATVKSATDELALASIHREEAERRIALAKDVASRAQSLRTSKVKQVFNDELNSVWRELFIRLAPEEAFVPAFALPKTSSGSVEAVLETHYRSGGKGGNPRAMLSAGNLNTAALTLFLALNLSAMPQLPWLIIDDPVQSMDDVHIAQFAALLRTLKREGRQVILAVHDRQLFDYLSLELSPAFNGDRLITVELGRTSDGMTTAQWKPVVFQPDRAFAA
ncbi:AAA family ATPase [Pseudorhodobacter wandonensis]|uniref:AAA family ATPase n=1 Tax=Pseudorhodobacter wandonensis TaxID=1120568 RepID=UPI00067AE18D|nr:AAA family ATPase [Pseudorhodobacter wandonensis]